MFRVIELGHVVAGPTAGLILSELGFEVIKVERPVSGDISRHLIDTSAGTFPYYNRNKKSLSLDIKKPKGLEILRKLIQSSDILIDNYSADVLKNIGLDYENISHLNKRLIYVTIRGYGHGKYENRKSLDYPIEIDSGIAFMNGLKDRPLRLGASVVDMFSASMAVIGIYDALLKREKTGRGMKLDASLFPSAMFLVGQHIATFQIIKRAIEPLNESGFAWGIYDYFKTKDLKDIFVAVTTDEQWSKFTATFHISDEIARKYSTNKERYNHRKELIPYVAKILSSYDADSLARILSKEGIVYAFLRKPWDLLDDPECVSLMNRVHYNSETMLLPKCPVTQTMEERVPSLGENNVEILEELGYTTAEIRSMRDEGII